MFKRVVNGFLVAAVMLVACGKERLQIPELPVNFSTQLTDPKLSPLSIPGKSVTIDGYGVAGLIITRKLDGGYAAFDRCSTVNPEKKCAVKLDESGYMAVDPCSNAKFLLVDGTGSPVSPPAEVSLKQYTVFIGGNVLQVQN
ncbi:hypothetical protein C7T94_00275 [Pedobacter yulinensis]|uniref:Rieske domain-containing protein n=1 Tax=Pedobacter yulinensis TaxID=2126353 RepID=A0A2T3HQE1_9SPHI|nr:hypothetical protein [Pedobacter yulinensis]PST84611.1 hypothetical protein C7T94_00275 [Pedobacter yulinensis]